MKKLGIAIATALLITLLVGVSTGNETSNLPKVLIEVPVENIQAELIATIELPGKRYGDSIDFDYTVKYTSASFEPGVKKFKNKRVDFSGTESAFIEPVYTGTVTLPAKSGVGEWSATFRPNAAITVPGVQSGKVSLGDNYSENYLDVLIPEAPGRMVARQESFSSPLVPELNNEEVECPVDTQIVSVDAINGVVSMTSSGTVIATQEAARARWSNAGGLAFLSLGVFGMAFGPKLRRRRDS